jgi:hypothetical protein
MIAGWLQIVLLSINLPSVGPDGQLTQPVSTPQSVQAARHDGEVEARAEIAAGKPTRLFTRVFNTRCPGFDTPGLLNCDVRSAVGPQSEALFTWLHEADWGEASPYPAHYQENVGFAGSFNRTMFLARRDEIMRTCPKAQLLEPNP